MTTTLTAKHLPTQLSRRLANFGIPDSVLEKLAERISLDGLNIGRLNPCIYGICIDYFSDKAPEFDQISHNRGIVKWEVFPYGIIDWDRYHVRVAYQVDELEGKGLTRGFDH